MRGELFRQPSGVGSQAAGRPLALGARLLRGWEALGQTPFELGERLVRIPDRVPHAGVVGLRELTALLCIGKHFHHLETRCAVS